MTFSQWQQRNPGVPVFGDGVYMVVACGKGLRFTDLERAKAAKKMFCGLFCAGPEHHRGGILDEEKTGPAISASWKGMVERA